MTRHVLKDWRGKQQKTGAAAPEGRVEMTMHQNKKGNRAAAAIVLTVLGAAVAWWGIGLRPGEGASPGAGAEKAFDKLKAILKIDRFEAELILIDPKAKPDTANEEKIRNFCSMLAKER